jgi:transposase-like protein
MAQRGVDVSKQSRWLDLVQRWQRSDLSVRDFCQQHQLTEANFYSWRRELRKRGFLVEPTEPQPTPTFIPVTVEAEPARGIELLVGNHVLRVHAGFDAGLLLELLRLLEERA